jgi:hypothetical protein
MAVGGLDGLRGGPLEDLTSVPSFASIRMGAAP